MIIFIKKKFIVWFLYEFYFFNNLITSLALDVEFTEVGELCTADYDCGSDLLYCSENNVCLCNQHRANFLYEFRHHFDIREPICEVRQCTISKSVDGNECVLHGAKCIIHPDKQFPSGIGYCKCPENTIGTRRASLLSRYGTYCKEVVFSSVGESCSSNSPVCDRSKKLKCNKYECECYDDHVFDFDKDVCVKKELFESHSLLGQYQQYCSTYTDCNDGMSCTNKKCDCPNFCSEEVVKTDTSCYCPIDYSFTSYTVLAVIGSFAFYCFLFWFIRKRRRAALQQMAEQGNIIIIQTGGNTNNTRVLTPNEILNLSNVSASSRSNLNLVQQPTAPPGGFVPVQQPAVHARGYIPVQQPTAPAGEYNFVLSDAPPSYNEAFQQNSGPQNSMVHHYMGKI